VAVGRQIRYWAGTPLEPRQASGKVSFPHSQRSSHEMDSACAASTVARVGKCACTNFSRMSVDSEQTYIESLLLLLTAVVSCLVFYHVLYYLVCLPSPAWLIVGMSTHEDGWSRKWGVNEE
jgi:hypothetical protein